ncbi:MAG: hypothetical protein K2I21_10355, partial [Acetatifactor sp.]|nr:hypothetical protein [Acetatifactor sp.]
MKTADFWNLKSTRKILLVSAFLMLLCVGRMLWSNREYLYEGETLFQEGTAISDYPIFEGISLLPGVYRVELVYSCSTDMQNQCRVEDGNVFAGGLLTHGEQLYSGLFNTDFDMWLFDQTDTLQVLINYDGQGYLKTGDLR